MTQRKPSDERIESKANRSAYIKTEDHPIEFEPYKAGFIHGATWCRDNRDPWFYVEDGELPELDVSKEDYVKETGEPVKIYKSKELLLMDYGGETSKGFFVTYESLNGYKASCFEIENTGIEVETDQVKCWIPIFQPQK